MTLEPCQMCAGAIIQARMDRVVIGSMNPKAGCGGSILNLLEMKEFNHQAEVERGVLEEECGSLLSSFFRRLRREKSCRPKKNVDGTAGNQYNKERVRETGTGRVIEVVITSRTRNAVVRKGTWVRIPHSP